VKTNKATLRVAFFVLGLLSFSCRQDETPYASTPISFAPVFTPGDVFLYDAYLTDQYGYTILSSRSKVQWKVLSTGFVVPGIGIGTVFVDSASVMRDSASVFDTVTVAVSANGDVYRHGLLATIARLRHLPAIPDSWDRVAAFSGGSNRSFFVGYMDSAQTEKVYGTITGTPDMYTAKVRGQQAVFPAYRVDLLGPHLEYTCWLADQPAGFMVIWLDPQENYGGVELTLSEIRAGS
jgi:hypothetical protein